MLPVRIRLASAALSAAVMAFALVPSSAYAAVTGDVEISHPSGTNPHGFEELLFDDVADQTRGPLAAESPAASTIATQGAFGESLLSSGAIGLAASTEVETIGFGTVYRSAAHAEVRYDETLMVTSTTLAPGTPVDVSMLYAATADAFAFHDLAPGIVASQSSQQADAVVSVVVRLDPASGTQQSTTSYLIDTVGGTPQQTGIFASPNGLDQLTVSTTVGSSVRLRMTANVTPASRAQPYQPSLGQPLVLPLAFGDAGLGLAFGVEASIADVEVVSPILGAPFPDFSNATLINAEAMLPALPVPEPGVTSGVMIGWLALLARRKRDARVIGRSAPRRRRDSRGAPDAARDRHLHSSRPLRPPV